MNAISTQLCDPINSGLTRWRMTVLNSGTGLPTSSRETKFSGANEDREIFIFRSADHEQDWQPYPIDPYSCYMCDHTCIPHEMEYGTRHYNQDRLAIAIRSLKDKKCVTIVSVTQVLV